MYKLEKDFWISCSHRLNNDKLDIEENKKLFGKCNNTPSHGHNYKIILHLKQSILNDKTGMIKNFYDIKKIFNDIIDERFDHQFLNNDDAFKNIVPTAENMSYVFYKLLKPHLLSLYKVTIQETEGARASFEEDTEE